MYERSSYNTENSVFLFAHQISIVFYVANTPEKLTFNATPPLFTKIIFSTPESLKLSNSSNSFCLFLFTLKWKENRI